MAATAGDVIPTSIAGKTRAFLIFRPAYFSARLAEIMVTSSTGTS